MADEETLNEHYDETTGNICNTAQYTRASWRPADLKHQELRRHKWIHCPACGCEHRLPIRACPLIKGMLLKHFDRETRERIERFYSVMNDMADLSDNDKSY